jgi:hypothetical protein
VSQSETTCTTLTAADLQREDVLECCLHVTCIVSASGLRIGADAAITAVWPAEWRAPEPRAQEGVEMAGLVRMSLDSPEEGRPFEGGTGQVQLLDTRKKRLAGVPYCRAGGGQST